MLPLSNYLSLYLSYQAKTLDTDKGQKMQKNKHMVTGSNGLTHFRTSARVYTFAVVGSWCGDCGADARCCAGVAYFSMTREAAERQLKTLASSRYDASWPNRQFAIVPVKVGA